MVSNYRGQSMYPTFKDRDKLYIQPANEEDFRRGDIIAFFANSYLVVHRILKLRKTQDHQTVVITSGDKSNPYSLDLPVKFNQVLGRVEFYQRGSRVYSTRRLFFKLRTTFYLYYRLTLLKINELRRKKCKK